MSSSSFRVNGKNYTQYDPYIIAEIGVNHEGSILRATQMIESAARSGAHAVKFQSYRAETLASKKHSKAYWDLSSEPTDSQYELFSRYPSFSFEDYEKLSRKALSVGVDFLSTPFDAEIADMLDPLVPAFKIASADLTNIPLIRHLMSLKKPLIVSTGAATVQEIRNSMQLLSNYKHPVAFLHCVLNYPTRPINGNLLMIERLSEMAGENWVVGYSDHIPPSSDGRLPQLELAFGLGAVVLEKHFTDNRSAVGNDHYHASSETELLSFTRWVSNAKIMLGSGKPEIEVQESARSNARRRIFSAISLEPGVVIEEKHLISLRADVGAPVTEWDSFLGQTLDRSVGVGEPLLRDYLKN